MLANTENKKTKVNQATIAQFLILITQQLNLLLKG